MVNPKTDPKHFLSSSEKNRVVHAIREAEVKTSGEICIYLEKKARGPLMKRARKIFEKLGMTRTEKRNGVLIYLSLQTREFAILGDKGIHEAVGPQFWSSIAKPMETAFQGGDFAGSLVKAVEEIGKKLALFFPWDLSDENELPNRISP